MTALNRAGWRPEMNTAGGADDNVTFTGNRALMAVPRPPRRRHDSPLSRT